MKKKWLWLVLVLILICNVILVGSVCAEDKPWNEWTEKDICNWALGKASSFALGKAGSFISSFINNLFFGSTSQNAIVDLSQKSLNQIRAIVNSELQTAINNYAANQDYRNAMDDFRYLETAMREYSYNLIAGTPISSLTILLENINETANRLEANKTFLYDKTYNPQYWLHTGTYSMLAAMRIGILMEMQKQRLRYSDNYIKTEAKRMGDHLGEMNYYGITYCQTRFTYTQGAYHQPADGPPYYDYLVSDNIGGKWFWCTGGIVTNTITSQIYQWALQYAGDYMNQYNSLWNIARTYSSLPAVALWYLDGNSGDSTGNGNNGIFYGSPNPNAIGKVNQGLALNGTNYMLVSNSPTLNFGTGDFSIALWLKTGSTKYNNTLFDKREAYGGKGYHGCIYGGQALIQLNDGTAYNYIGGGILNDDKWHHLVFTIDRDNPSGLIFYIDGVVKYTANPTNRQNSLANNIDLLIGQHSTSSINNFEGILDEISFYNQALTLGQVAELYNRNNMGMH